MGRSPNFHVFVVPLMPAGGAVEDTTQSETKPMGNKNKRLTSEHRPCVLVPCCRGSRTSRAKWELEMGLPPKSHCFFRPFDAG